MEKINVLFTAQESNYKNDSRFFAWSIKEDALKCIARSPVICHPPCRLFGRMRKFSTADHNEKLLGYYSIGLVRKVGGIVEHPRSSTLWKDCQVGTASSPDQYGGYLISVNLSWFGFPCEKKTGLYIVGIPFSRLPAQPVSFDAIEKTISTSKRKRLVEIEKNLRSSTPVKMIDWFCLVIEAIRNEKNKS